MAKYKILKGDEPLKKLSKVQEGTIKDLKDKIDSHGIALMIRPTGFGKTYTMINFCNEFNYRHVIYMYPTNVIKQSIEDDYHNTNPPEDGKEPKPIRYAASFEEQRDVYPDKPWIEFISYSKMLVDWNNNESKIQGLAGRKLEDARKAWIKEKFKGVDLLILDEAHTTGAHGFLKYWKYIHAIIKAKGEDRFHVLGATATPLRTSLDINIEDDIFYYYHGGKKSARIKDFDFLDCWKQGILKYPYYTKGILDKDEESKFLKAKLHKYITGVEEGEDLSLVVKSKRSSKSSDIKVINDPRQIYLSNLLKSELSKLTKAIDDVPSPDRLIYNAVNKVIPERFENGHYMRFLVFYQNTDDMIKYHEKINQAFRDAFSIGQIESKYTTLNVNYIVSNEEKLAKHNIKASGVDVIAKRDKDIGDKFDKVKGNVDLIHSINMLNMGYHVGAVTGVVVKRSTSSEIIYYQQIGRCMSVKAEHNPIIIDFANAESELYNKTHDTLREEAARTIAQFIGGCELIDDYEKTAYVYKLVNMYIAEQSLSDDLLLHLYDNRKAPIYFIKGVADSLNCQESLEDIMVRLVKILLNNNLGDIEIDNYVLNEMRLGANIRGSERKLGIIQEEQRIAKKIGIEVSGDA